MTLDICGRLRKAKKSSRDPRNICDQGDRGSLYASTKEEEGFILFNQR